MERLPHDVLRLIGARLPPAALAALAATSRAYRFLAKARPSVPLFTHL